MSALEKFKAELAALMKKHGAKIVGEELWGGNAEDGDVYLGANYSFVIQGQELPISENLNPQ